MNNAHTPSQRLPALAGELTRCTDELLACIEREEMEPFDTLLNDRRTLLDELHSTITSAPEPESGWRVLFADVLASEARLKARVEAEHRRLAGELQGVGEARTNIGRIAEAYMEPDV